MKQVIQIRCKNNKKTQKVAIGSTLFDIFSEIGLEMSHGPISCKVNNKVEGMHYRVYNSKDLEFLDMTSSSGSRAYTRTLFFVLCKAALTLGYIFSYLGYFLLLQSLADIDNIG